MKTAPISCAWSRRAGTRFLAALALLVPLLASAAPPTVATVVGGENGDDGPAIRALLLNPEDVAVDSSGNYYVADGTAARVRKVDALTKEISTFAGTGEPDASGDGSQATAAAIGFPTSVAVDNVGNVYILDYDNRLVRKIDSNGIISTVAGGGSSFADGIQATAADLQLNSFSKIAVDQAGNLYIDGFTKVRKVDLDTGRITTVAGSGTYGFSGDGGLATTAKLAGPSGMAVDGAGDIYIADRNNARIRKVDAHTGNIATIAGDGTFDSITPGPATGTSIYAVSDITLDPTGSTLYLSTPMAILSLDLTSNTISILAGSGTPFDFGIAGDGQSAATARFQRARGIGINPANGDLYIADWGNNRVRVISSSMIDTVAGTFFAGDGGQARHAIFGSVEGMGFDAAGNLYIGDAKGHRIRKVTPNGVISTVAGNGTAGYSGDGGDATLASINVDDVAVDATGNIYIASGARVRKVDTSGIISTVAGNGTLGYSGDWGQATDAEVAASTVAVDASGDNLYIAQASGGVPVVRRVHLPSDTISTFAGNGTDGNTGDGGAALDASLGQVFDLAVAGNGNVYIGDTKYCVVRMVKFNDPIHTIQTVAGSGNNCSSSAPLSFADGADATSVDLDGVMGLSLDSNDNLFLSAGLNHSSVQKVTPEGKIYRFAGQRGVFTYTGDGGPARDATFGDTRALAIDPMDNVFIGDLSYHVVRELQVDQIFKNGFD